MEKYYLVKAEDIPQAYNDSGFAMSELLAGTYEGGIRNYKCFLKAGCHVSPELRKEETVLLMFGKGTGYIYSKNEMHNIRNYRSMRLILTRSHTPFMPSRTWNSS